MSIDKKRDLIIATIESAGHEIDGPTFGQFLGPGVYIVFRRGDPLYVGSAQNMMYRMSHPKHAQRETIETADKVRLLPCRSHAAAKRLEAVVIRFLRPLLNTNTPTYFRRPQTAELALDPKKRLPNLSQIDAVRILNEVVGDLGGEDSTGQHPEVNRRTNRTNFPRWSPR
jgi:hypothetical protein